MKDIPWKEDLPELRRCARCKKWKSVREEFTSRIYRSKSKGLTYRLPGSYCRQCERERVDAWEESQPGGRRGYKAREHARRYRKSPARREYIKDWKRMKNALEGKKIRGPQSGYPAMKLVPNEPFVEWWNSLNGNRPTEAEMGEALARTVRRAVTGESQRMHLDQIDEVGVLVGIPHLIHLLYPNI